MKKRKIIALFMAAAILQNSMTAFAAEGETEDNVSSFAEDMEDSSMAAGEDAGSAYTVRAVYGDT